MLWVLCRTSESTIRVEACSKCSPKLQMKWMDHFLSSGQLAGKITCPNKKCGAKLGNFDWAGQCCGCKEWATPVRCFLLLVFSSIIDIDHEGVLHQPIQGRRSSLNHDFCANIFLSSGLNITHTGVRSTITYTVLLLCIGTSRRAAGFPYYWD